ncbi:unnamed protein product [Schistosoma mattheei]|uniref:Uncharacterized protein n=1 Tax=Schistosoma mattheei TaxID=31246 RepID=A0A183NP80_9TREM|nr:unnamed protein product [Schistosoma mattheei]
MVHLFKNQKLVDFMSIQMLFVHFIDFIRSINLGCVKVLWRNLVNVFMHIYVYI